MSVKIAIARLKLSDQLEMQIHPFAVTTVIAKILLARFPHSSLKAQDGNFLIPGIVVEIVRGVPAVPVAISNTSTLILFL